MKESSSLSGVTGGSAVYVTILTYLVTLGSFLFGLHVGFSSPTSKAIQYTEDISSSNLNTVFSLLAIGAVIGALLVGRVAESIGRRYALLLNAIPYTVGSLLFVSWTSFGGLAISRVIIGVGVGWSASLCSLYVAEVAPAHLRGVLGCAAQLQICVGILFVNCLGLPCTDIEHMKWWKDMVLISIVPTGVMFVGCFLFAPETPAWLISKGRHDEAKAALLKLRGGNSYSGLESEFLELTNQDGGLQNMSTDEDVGQAKPWSHPTIRGPMVVGMALMIFQQWCGVNVFNYNAASLFDDDSDDEIALPKKALVGSIICQSVQVLGVFIVAPVINRRGRRWWMLLSYGTMAVSCGVLGAIYIAGMSMGYKLALIMIYYLAFSAAAGPLTWVIASEIFPMQVRSTAVSLATATNWLMGFVVPYTFPPLRHLLGMGATLWVYGVVCLIAVVFVYFKVPETRGLTLDQVGQLFDKEEKENDNGYRVVSDDA